MKRLVPVGLALGVLLLTAWALAPGLDGGFLFDDFVNLSALGDYGGVRGWHTLALYLTSGSGDPLGRPLSLLTFLLDATDWPAAPRPFLRTNIALHLLDGALLMLVLRRFGRARSWEPLHATRAAIVGAALWLLHPLLLSTTLYIVQREAMLATTFALLALLAWTAGRDALHAGKTRAGYALLALAAFGCTAVATLCKANGLLIPLLLGTIEATLLSGTPIDVRMLRARRILLGVPIAALVLLLLGSTPAFIESAAQTRPWTLTQRLLTEPRVLLDYVALLVLPQPISRGVFHDDFAVSQDLLHPASTLPALIAIVALVAAAWRWRRRWPVPAFSVLFFFAGHLLEASVVPLELYFEHRNYLPATMAFWPFAAWLTRPGAALARIRLAAALLIVGALAVDTRLGAQTWGQPTQLAFAWARQNPDSPRAQAYAAQFEMAAGANDAAIRRLSLALAKHPDEAQLVFNLIDAHCAADGLSPRLAAAAEHALERDAQAAGLDFAWLSNAVERARAGQCAGLDFNVISTWLDAVRRNPRFADAPGRTQDFEHVRGMLYVAQRDSAGALAAFDRALAVLPTPDLALQQAAVLGNAGWRKLGLAHLDGFLAAHPLEPAHLGVLAKPLHAWLLSRYDYWPSEFARMRALLAQENDAVKPSDTPITEPGGAQ